MSFVHRFTAGTRRRASNPRHIELGAATGIGSNVSYRLGMVASRVPLLGAWLDCGCADGVYSRALRDLGAERVVGVDVDEARVGLARRLTSDPGLDFRQAEAEALPFEDATFDGVWLNEVLEHVNDEAATLAEVYRVLKPGGHLAVMSPNRWFPFEGHGIRFAGRKVDVPFPFVPWLPTWLTRQVTRARNYWPGELRALVSATGAEVLVTCSVLPVFEAMPLT